MPTRDPVRFFVTRCAGAALAAQPKTMSFQRKSGADQLLRFRRNFFQAERQQSGRDRLLLDREREIRA